METTGQKFLLYPSPFLTALLTVISITPVHGGALSPVPQEDLFFLLSEGPLLSELSLLADCSLSSVLNRFVFPRALSST